MNRMFASAMIALAIAAASTQFTGAQGQGKKKTAEKRGDVTRVHHDKRRSGKRPDWVTAAVRRGHDHLALAPSDAGVEDPATELVLDTATEDDFGQTLLRFDQVHKGIPVYGSQVVVELDDASGHKTFGKADASVRRVNVTPTISAEAAVQAATAALGYTGTFSTPPSAALVILPAGLPAGDERGSATLTWLVELGIDDGTEAAAQHRYFVDARDGAIVLHFDALNHATGTSYYSGNVTINTAYALLNDGVSRFRLWDQARGFYTTDMNNATNGDGYVFSNNTNVWGNTSPWRETAGVDAHFGVAMAWDYFRQKQGWTGINGAGEGVKNHVHHGETNNASQLNGVLSYGDGDGTSYRPWVSVDVVAHEYTHAVVERTARLVYIAQSGALNESFADIFGTAVEFNTGIRPDYLIGEDVGIYRPLRSMANPPLYNQPDHLSRYVNSTLDKAGDYGGVHTNSGIPNKAFYLLAEGGTHPISGVTVPRITRPAAEWIYFRALRRLTPTATFSQARAAVLSAAADGYGLYSQAWYAAKASWDAVGVY